MVILKKVNRNPWHVFWILFCVSAANVLALTSCTIPKEKCDTPSLVWVRLCGQGLCLCPLLCLRSVIHPFPDTKYEVNDNI